jgi:hypothetical protein
LTAYRKYNRSPFRFWDIRVIEYCALDSTVETLSTHTIVTTVIGE